MQSPPNHSLRISRHRHAPTEVTFRLSPRYGIHNARDAHAWFLMMMAENEEFEVETDRAGELPMPFWSETVRRVVVE